MASLIDLLAAGIKNSDGTPIDSGAVSFYQLGTLASQPVYSDDEGTIVYSQPVTLDGNGAATVYTKSPVRFIVNDSTGTQVVDVARAGTEDASEVEVDNDSFSGNNLDEVLTAAQTSFGTTDWKYVPTPGLDGMPYQTWLNQAFINVKAFGAKGDGATDDTATLQAAINYAAGLTYRPAIYFPPGLYLTTSGLTIPASGMALFSTGVGGATISLNHATANGFTATAVNGITFDGLKFVVTTGTTTGAAVQTRGCDGVYLNRIVTTSGWGVAVDFNDNTTTGTSDTWVRDCTLAANTDVNGACIRYGATATATGQPYNHNVANSSFNVPTGRAVDVYGAYDAIRITGSYMIAGTSFYRQASAATGGTFVSIAGCQSLVGAQIVVPTVQGHVTEAGCYWPAGLTITDASTIGGEYMSGRQGPYMGANLAFAEPLTLGTGGSTFSVTTSGTIKGITTQGWRTGSVVRLRFVNGATIKHGVATGAGAVNFVLAAAADYVALAGNTLTVFYDGTNWVELARASAGGG